MKVADAAARIFASDPPLTTGIYSAPLPLFLVSRNQVAESLSADSYETLSRSSRRLADHSLHATWPQVLPKIRTINGCNIGSPVSDSKRYGIVNAWAATSATTYGRSINRPRPPINVRNSSTNLPHVTSQRSLTLKTSFSACSEQDAQSM